MAGYRQRAAASLADLIAEQFIEKGIFDVEYDDIALAHRQNRTPRLSLRGARQHVDNFIGEARPLIARDTAFGISAEVSKVHFDHLRNHNTCPWTGRYRDCISGIHAEGAGLHFVFQTSTAAEPGCLLFKSKVVANFQSGIGKVSLNLDRMRLAAERGLLSPADVALIASRAGLDQLKVQAELRQIIKLAERVAIAASTP